MIADATLPAILPERRGACPSLSAPMQTGDGFLVRFRIASKGLHPLEMARLAELAGKYGNGVVEITARGNIQVRGLDVDTAEAFAAALQASDIGLQNDVMIDTSPLADIDPTCADGTLHLAEILRSRIAADIPPGTLAPKFSIVIDGGGVAPLCDVIADIRLDTIPKQSGLWRLAIAGNAGMARNVGLIDDHDVADAVMEILTELSNSGAQMRGRDLDVQRLRASLAIADTPAFSTLPQKTGIVLGSHTVPGARILGIAPAYGKTSAAALIGLMRGLAALGANNVRPAHGHMLLVLGLATAALKVAKKLAQTHAFWTENNELERCVSVCTGSNGCASGTFDTGAIAGTILMEAPSLFDGSLDAHVSGCTKGCAHPVSAPITLCGTAAGVGVVLNGKAGGKPAAVLMPDQISSVFAQLEILMRRKRRNGETARTTLDRLSPDDLQTVFQQGLK